MQKYLIGAALLVLVGFGLWLNSLTEQRDSLMSEVSALKSENQEIEADKAGLIVQIDRIKNESARQLRAADKATNVLQNQLDRATKANSQYREDLKSVSDKVKECRSLPAPQFYIDRLRSAVKTSSYH